MKYLKYTTVIFLSLLLLCACNQEESINSVASNNINLKLRVSNSVPDKRTKAIGEEPILKESTISNVYTFFFQKDVSDTNQPVFFYKEENIAKLGTWEKSFVKSLTGLVDNMEYDIYVLANIPANVSSLSETITKRDLLSFTETVSNTRQSDGSDISFSGIATFHCGMDSNILIELKRTVARLDITINKAVELGDDWGVETVEVSNENANTLYFTDVVKNGTSRKAEKGQAWKIGDSNFYRYYTYENESTTSETEQLLLLITLKNNKTSETKIYKVVVNNSGNNQVERNYIYKVTLTLNDTPPEPLDVTWIIVPFNDVNIDASVQATYLNLNKTIVPVMNIYEGILSVETDAEKLHVDLSKIGGFALSSHENEKEVDIPMNSNGKLELHFYLNSGEGVVPDGEVILSAGNLKKSITLKKEETSVTLNHVSAQMTGGTEIITDGTVLPWHVYKDSNNGKNGQLNLTVERNCTWHYKIYIYASDGMQVVHDGSNFPYNGIPGTETVHIPLPPNTNPEDEVQTVYLTVGYDHINFDFSIYTLVFKINEYNK